MQVRAMLCALPGNIHSSFGTEELRTARVPPPRAALVRAADPPVLRAQIEQVGESRILWHKQEFATLLNVIEDTRDAEHMTTSFELIQSDILGKFNGRWTLTPLHEDGEVVGCCAVLDQDLLPKGLQPGRAPARDAWCLWAKCTSGKTLLPTDACLLAKSASSSSVSLPCLLERIKVWSNQIIHYSVSTLDFDGHAVYAATMNQPT